MTPEQQQLYKAAVQKVRDEVMAAVQAATTAANGTAAGRNARARNLNQKYFAASDTEAAMAPIPISKRKRGRPSAGKGKGGGVCVWRCWMGGVVFASVGLDGCSSTVHLCAGCHTLFAGRDLLASRPCANTCADTTVTCVPSVLLPSSLLIAIHRG